MIVRSVTRTLWGWARGSGLGGRPLGGHVPSLLRLMREQWIRAKYERQEFTHPERQEPYSAGEAAHTWASRPAPAPQNRSRAPRNLGSRFSV